MAWSEYTHLCLTGFIFFTLISRMVALENASMGDISISYGPAGRVSHNSTLEAKLTYSLGIKGLIRSPFIFSQAMFASIGGFLYG